MGTVTVRASWTVGTTAFSTLDTSLASGDVQLWLQDTQALRVDAEHMGQLRDMYVRTRYWDLGPARICITRTPLRSGVPVLMALRERPGSRHICPLRLLGLFVTCVHPDHSSAVCTSLVLISQEPVEAVECRLLPSQDPSTDDNDASSPSPAPTILGWLPGPGLDVGVVQLRITMSTDLPKGTPLRIRPLWDVRFQFRDGMATGEDGDTGDVVTFPAPLP